MEDLYKHFTKINDKIVESMEDFSIPHEELEIEGRLGLYSGTEFSANIGEHYFKQIQTLLSQVPLAKLGATQECIDQKDFFHDNLRLSVCNNQKTCVEKRKYCHFGFRSPKLTLYMRFSISRETTRSIELFPNHRLHELFCRHKRRLRYTLPTYNMYLDLTEIAEHHPDIGKSFKSFEYEVETIDPRKESDFFYTVHGIFLVLLDAVAYCKDSTFVKNATNQHNLRDLFPIEFIEPKSDGVSRETPEDTPSDAESVEYTFDD